MPRNTQQRAAIRQAFELADRPLSPAEALGVAKEIVPGLGIASRYEVAGKHHHHHFRCRICDRVFDVDACPPDLSALTPRGFRLEGHDITLFGRCAACARG